MATNVLQLGGGTDWSDKYKMSKELQWDFNNFPPKKPKVYSAVVITGMVYLTDKNWDKLLWASPPYCVFYQPGVKEQLSPAGQRFIKLNVGQPLKESPEELIQDIQNKYYFGQTGIRVNPVNLVLNTTEFRESEFLDAGHLKLTVDSDEWVPLGAYRQQLYVDPYRQLRIWLECRQDPGVELRIVTYQIQNHHKLKTFAVTNKDVEQIIPTPIKEKGQFVSAGLEIRGHGQTTIGPFHYSWARHGAGIYLVGAKRLIDPDNKEQIAYMFNPGDLKPPLNIYFSGARGAEGFEAYPLFRGLKAPTILFTDPRLEIGQFYTGKYLEGQIKQTITRVLKQLGFSNDDLMLAGVSMGTYPAIKLGAELQAHAVIVSKSLTNLGYIAKRSRLERPDEFETMFDIDRQLTDLPFPKGLDVIDEAFWRQFDRNDLSKTRLFIAYMLDDDYDNHSVPRLKKSPAVQNAEQFITIGYPGHHNDNTNATVGWMIYRIRQLMREDFGRKDAR